MWDFLVFEAQEILIVRVLHYRMDVTRHSQFTADSAAFLSKPGSPVSRLRLKTDAFQRSGKLPATDGEQLLQLRFLDKRLENQVQHWCDLAID